MANSKISALTSLAGGSIDAANDVLPIVDTSATTTKKCTPSGLRLGMFSGALVKKSADETAANYTSQTAIPFNAEEYDVGGWHDTVTNNTRLTVPSGVAFAVFSGAVWTSSQSNAYHNLALFKNGAIVLGGAGIVTSVAGGTILSYTSSPLAVTAGDYFELMFLTVADTSITLESEATCFSAYAVG